MPANPVRLIALGLTTGFGVVEALVRVKDAALMAGWSQARRRRTAR